MNILKLSLIMLITSALIISGCSRTSTGSNASKPLPEPEKIFELPDGTYRGGFYDLGIIQINIEFILKDGIVQEAEFRHMVRDEYYFMGTEIEPYRSVIAQYEEALQYLVGKKLSTHLKDLYEPENLVTLEVDGYSAATLRTNKIIVSVRDAILKGVYSFE